MSGCLGEYNASYVNANDVEILNTYGGSFTTGTSTYLATSYPAIKSTVGSNNAFCNVGTSYPGFNKIFGDAIYETSSDVGRNQAWFGQSVEYGANNNELFFSRGGLWNSTANVGLCGLFDYNGAAAYDCGFRTVLVVE